MNILLSSAYIPSISYLSLFTLEFPIYWDPWENFQKQSFRNRSHILSPNGILVLSVPVQKTSRRGTPMKEVRISYEYRWQREQWMSLQSAYRRSSYFEYYEDQIQPFFEKPYEFLWDLNLEWIGFFQKSFQGIHALNITDSYKNPYESSFEDFREIIHPKRLRGIEAPSYPQVFDFEGKFYEEMSVLDLLFNQGPRGINYLKALGNHAFSSYLNRI